MLHNWEILISHLQMFFLFVFFFKSEPKVREIPKLRKPQLEKKLKCITV